MKQFIDDNPYCYKKKSIRNNLNVVKIFPKKHVRIHSLLIGRVRNNDDDINIHFFF